MEDTKTNLMEADETVLMEDTKTNLMEADETVLMEDTKTVSMEDANTVLMEAAKTVMMDDTKTNLMEAAKTVLMEADETVLMEAKKTVLMEAEKTVLSEDAKAQRKEAVSQHLLSEGNTVMDDIAATILQKVGDISLEDKEPQPEPQSKAYHECSHCKCIPDEGAPPFKKCGTCRDVSFCSEQCEEEARLEHSKTCKKHPSKNRQKIAALEKWCETYLKCMVDVAYMCRQDGGPGIIEFIPELNGDGTLSHENLIGFIPMGGEHKNKDTETDGGYNYGNKEFTVVSVVWPKSDPKIKVNAVVRHKELDDFTVKEDE